MKIESVHSFGIEYPGQTGGYFMSEQQQDAVVGRVVRERTAARQRLAALQAEAAKIGKVMANLSSVLSQEPQHLVFENQSHNMKYSRANAPLFKSSDIPDANRLIQLGNDIRDTMEELDKLDDQAAKLGL